MIEKSPRRRTGVKRSPTAKVSAADGRSGSLPEHAADPEAPGASRKKAGTRSAAEKPIQKPRVAKKAAGPNEAEKSLILLERRAKTAGALLAAAERALELEQRQKEGNARTAERPAATAKRVQRLRAELERRLDRLLAAEHPEGVAGGTDGAPD